MTVEKINFETAERIDQDNRMKHAIPSQNIFRAVVRRAEGRGMRVNAAKTNLLVVSDALSFNPRAKIIAEDGTVVTSGSKMKILGFHMSDRPSAGAHVEALRKRFRQRYWILFHLKNFGFTTEELCKVYRTILRPVADYCSVVYHALLTDEQDEALEKCQSHALRCIFGKDISYAKMREMAGVPTLRERRVTLCDKFAQKCLKNPRFSGWFPRRNSRRSSRGGEEFLEQFARCDRLRNSPVYYMRRRLNGKIGKEYGARYKDRRGTITPLIDAM